MLVLLAVLLPALIAVAGLVLDGGVVMDEHHRLQHVADGAATAAAVDLRLGNPSATAIATAEQFVHATSGMPDAQVVVSIPPTSGDFAGLANHVQVDVQRDYQTVILRGAGGLMSKPISARAVAGVADATDGAAIMALDPDPAPIDLGAVDDTLSAVAVTSVVQQAVAQSPAVDYLAGVPIVGGVASALLSDGLEALLPDFLTQTLTQASTDLAPLPLPTITAGLEVEGLGQVRVEGAVLINTTWGGVDQDGRPAGVSAGPPYGSACMPLLPTTQLLASDIRVTGGVDDQDQYQPLDPDDESPLRANMLPTDDPLEALPPPSTSVDATNVSGAVRSPSHAIAVALSASDAAALLGDVLSGLSPLLQPLLSAVLTPVSDLLENQTLQPGVYDSITVVAPVGGVIFEPGVYVIRGRSPLTNLSLLALGPVQADGAMFYITDSASYDATTGMPDAGVDASTAPPASVGTVVPSVVLAPLLAGAAYTGLQDPTSPYDGVLVYQARSDRRPIVIDAQHLLGGGALSGTVYAKWGHTILLTGAGSCGLRMVSGTMRIVTVTDATINPVDLLPAAQDVYLLE
ncbi:pilus assembly protein TadG-related protein [Posidoniimonas corsicana]|uniref:pilus assembly protein TadG-related protein n=1 Tax=Posidoniimonas corsicana TaxID=1938618 RepID=UPI0018D29740|nr:pilus assembly protein TadG-related protein [Posidoniimonas corsicana]